MRIVLFGLGHVGATTTACLAQAGHDVLGVDPEPARVAAVAAGRAPVREPGLDALLRAGVAAGRIAAATTAGEALAVADLAMVCVATPPTADRRGLDLARLVAVAQAIGAAIRGRRRAGRPLLVVLRSTVPPGATERLVLPAIAAAAGEGPGAAWEIAYHPEFAREGSAIADHRAPSRIVVGERAPGATRRLMGLYEGIAAPFLEVPLAVAELAKLVDNGWHALKVAFANEVGRLAVAHGLEPDAVAALLLADGRLNLGPAYLRPGAPYGGACLPKDLGALLGLADAAGLTLPALAGAVASNEAHLAWLLAAIRARVAPPGPVLQIGVSFKAGTDDLRGSPLVELARRLVAHGYALRLHDPDLDPARLAAAGRALPPAGAALLARGRAADLAAAAAGVRLVVLGKPCPRLRAHLPAGAPVLDLTRLAGFTRAAPAA
ncbi:nucleotide sugar dehydrogenase [Benzoatithermus flavus]|uniref:UDP-glucose 6-dehydrogenase n=1 Tax=Benzoatithermus flavus TaxID=3108223 RepID=A0ABU8XXR3_9PROT